MKLNHLTASVAALLLLCACGPRNGEHVLTILSTNDVHGRFFDSTYVDNRLSKSLLAVNRLVDSVRAAEGPDNVVLLDAGDCLQGDNAAYYFNFVDTVTEHIYSRMAAYMGYDAIAVGNHDIETGHAVYDRVTAELASHGIPFMAGNALRNDNGKPYFPYYKIVRRAGLKVAILGYENANIKAWLSEEIWSGMHFESLIPIVQEQVDAVRAKEKPDVVIAILHSGTGEGDGSMYESQALDVYQSIKGVDFILCGHDHRPYIKQEGEMGFLNAGSHCRFLAKGVLRVQVEGHKVVSRTAETSLIPVDAAKVDTAMRAHFHDDYLAVKAFTLRKVGELKCDLRTTDAYRGMSDYINLLHTLHLSCAPADISIAAPLTYRDTVKAGTLIYDDLFTIYPYENQLFVVRMTGEEFKKLLEFSYERWIQPVSSGHLLWIFPRVDARSGEHRWSFVERSYNFDSAGGVNYSVDITKPFGERIVIHSLVGGRAFDPQAEYNVAMTSYRANGGGDLLGKGAGIDTDRIDERIVARYPEIREILYEYLKKHGTIDPAVIGNPDVIGSWKFVPERQSAHLLVQDMALLFGE